MKVQCDVCGREEAALFCCADETALCHSCDRRVHPANKLSLKHRRLSLSVLAHPLCDVCQERRGFVFCQEDRAILCTDCDAPIHGANALTMKHARFLLPGVRLSSAPLSSSDSDLSSQVVGEDGTEQGCQVPQTNQVAAALVPESPLLCNETATTASAAAAVAVNGSSISDYLIKVCPGWHVEDLLVDDAAPAATAALADLGIGGGGLVLAAAEFPMWVPDAPQTPRPPEFMIVHGGITSTDLQSPWLGFNEMSPEHGLGAKVARDRWSIENAWTVPQVSTTASNPGKRARPQKKTWH